MLICPICKNKLIKESRSYICQNGHCYDISKFNYVNFLPFGKEHGDNKAMVQARNKFLNKDHYLPLKNELSKTVRELGNVSSYLDAGCGEGYYTETIAQNTESLKTWAVDISKEALKITSKRLKNINLAVASVYDMPFFEDSTFDLVTCIFSPFASNELRRVLKPDGYLIMVIPEKYHLYGFKKLIYEKPYENSVKSFEVDGFEFISCKNVEYNAIFNNEDANMLWKMTPYYFRTPKDGLEKLKNAEFVETPISFAVVVYRAKK